MFKPQPIDDTVTFLTTCACCAKRWTLVKLERSIALSSVASFGGWYGMTAATRPPPTNTSTIESAQCTVYGESELQFRLVQTYILRRKREGRKKRRAPNVSNRTELTNDKDAHVNRRRLRKCEPLLLVHPWGEEAVRCRTPIISAFDQSIETPYFVYNPNYLDFEPEPATCEHRVLI